MNSPVSSGCANPASQRNQTAPASHAPQHQAQLTNSRLHLTMPAPEPVLADGQRERKPRRKLRTFVFHGISIPYGEYTSGRIKYWMLFWRTGPHQPRLRESRVSFAALKSRAEEIAINIANGRTAMNDFREDDRATFRRCRELAAPLGVPLEILVGEAVEARKKLSRTIFVPKDCPKIVEEMLAAMRANGAGRRWLDDLESRAGRFAKHFTGPLHLVRGEEIKDWLLRLNLSRRSWNNNRTALLALVRFARERKHLPAEWDELATIKGNKLDKGEEEIYTPEEMLRLLVNCPTKLLPTLCIMGFAGLRHSELRDADNALDWRNVHLSAGQIHVSAALAKSNTGRRYAPIQPNLAAWLTPYARPSGVVCPYANLNNAFQRLSKAAGVPWKRNALRNSFISYRCVVTGNVAQVATEGGNSPQEIHDSYRKELSKAEGERWFSLLPTVADTLPLFGWGAGKSVIGLSE